MRPCPCQAAGTHCLEKLAALEAARGSFGAAHDAVTRRCGPVMGKRQLEQAVTGAAADIPAFYAARIPEPCTSATLLILSADCKGIVMRPAALRAATARAAVRLGKMTRIPQASPVPSERPQDHLHGGGHPRDRGGAAAPARAARPG